MTFRLKLGVFALAVVSVLSSILVSQTQGAPTASELEQRAAAARARESVLTTDVEKLSERVRGVEARLAPVEARWRVLNNELVGLRTRRQALTAQLETERAHLAKLEATLKKQRADLALRVSAAYRVGAPTVLEVLLRSGSLSEAASVRENLDRITNQDRGLVLSTRSNAIESRQTAERIRVTRNEVFDTEQKVAVKEAEAAKAFQVIASERDRLVSARNA